MGKEDLRSGLEGWIRNTREVAQDLVEPEATEPETTEPETTTAVQDAPPPPMVREAPPEPVAQVEPPSSAAALITTLHAEFRAITEKAQRLESLETEVDPTAREALAQDLVDLARTLDPLIVAPPPAPETDTLREKPMAEPPLDDASGVPQIPGDSFRSRVLEAEVPVLVELHLDGYKPCEEARRSLAEVAALYDGQVELCTLNVMEAEPEVLPQIVKVGRDFFDRNLPKVLLYQYGEKLGEASGDVSAQDLVELLVSEVR